MHIGQELSQRRFTKALLDEVVYSDRRDSLTLAVLTDSITDFRVAHRVANVLQTNAPYNGIATSYEPAVALMFLEVIEIAAFGFEHSLDLFSGHHFQGVVADGEGLNSPLNERV